ncbi:MAG: MAPEG family protein, partial [bacterium]
MTTPFWCLFVVVLLPYVLAGVGGYFRGKEFGDADNKNPRAQAARLEGTGARTYAAQANAWEATAVFTAAVFTAHLAGVPEASAAPWTIAFVVARVLHPTFYILDQDKLRSV